jgi:hypothetical protein
MRRRNDLSLGLGWAFPHWSLCSLCDRKLVVGYYTASLPMQIVMSTSLEGVWLYLKGSSGFKLPPSLFSRWTARMLWPDQSLVPGCWLAPLLSEGPNFTIPEDFSATAAFWDQLPHSVSRSLVLGILGCPSNLTVSQ